MSKRYDWNTVKNTVCDSDDTELSEIHGTWYKKQRYFSHSIFTVKVEGTVATIEYWKGDIDFKNAGKAHYSFKNSGDRGDLHCPCIFKIGNEPVIVVEEVFKETTGWSSVPYEELTIYSYNGGYRQFDGVYEVRGQTFLLNRMLFEMGFAGNKTSKGYVHTRPTPEEEEKMNAQEAESRKLYKLAKKKEREEEKEAKFEEFKQLHKEGRLVIAVQTGSGYSPITGIRIPLAPEGTSYVFAWFEEGKDEQIWYTNHRITKKHLKAIGLESVKAVNRWSIWFHAIDNEALKDFNIQGFDHTEYRAAWR